MVLASVCFCLHSACCLFCFYSCVIHLFFLFFFFFFNDTATTEIYTLSLHDALPIWSVVVVRGSSGAVSVCSGMCMASTIRSRSEEHTSELQSRGHLVCRLLLEKKKKKKKKKYERITIEKSMCHLTGAYHISCKLI